MATKEIAQVELSGVNAIDSLLSGVRWQNGTISYSFPVASSTFVSDYSSDREPWRGFATTTSAQRAGIRQALAAWAAVANVSFNEVSEPVASGVIRLAQSSAPDTAWSYYPDPSEQGGDVWFGYQYDYDNPHWQTYADYAYMTMVHELGHSLGLKHPGRYSSSDDAPYASSAIDALQYSIMSYLSYPGASLDVSVSSASYPQTPMMNDIAAVQYMYGANYNYNSGNTVYSFSPGDAKIFRTIWDGNGNDTYDASAYTTGVDLQLTPGAWSTLGWTQLADLGNGVAAPGSVANALLYQEDARSLIENAIGGSGDDSLRGNAADNQLSGGAGSDQLWGGSAGADVLTDTEGENGFWWTVGEGSDSFYSAGRGSAAFLYGFSFDDRRYQLSQEGHFWLGHKTNGSDYLTLTDWQNLSPSERIQSFVFNNGGAYKAYAWNGGNSIEVLLTSSAYRLAQVNALECVDSAYAKLGGSSGNDTIVGGGGGDDIWGGPGGDDYLAGGVGSDTYWFTAENGRDTIAAAADNNEDAVRFATSWLPTDLIIARNGYDLQLSRGSSVTVLEGWGYTGGYQLNRFSFDQAPGVVYQVEFSAEGVGRFTEVA